MLGNDAVSEYAFLGTYSPWSTGVIYPSGSAVKAPGIYTSGIPNPALTWEKTLSWNAGFDATLWNGLLGIELDAFYNYTYDVLTGMGGNKPSSMGGYYTTYGNNNALDSEGIDILLTHRNKLIFLPGVRERALSVSALTAVTACSDKRGQRQSSTGRYQP